MPSLVPSSVINKLKYSQKMPTIFIILRKFTYEYTRVCMSMSKQYKVIVCAIDKSPENQLTRK